MGAEGTIKTEPLTGTSKGQGDSGRLTPASGTVFARFWITGCNAVVLLPEQNMDGGREREVPK